ncbi:unnamed protein product [Clonostachys solani]|uniref:Chromo domain-containing protein n=1 Tax=Clonostachys solani TaxID=160281 RepID=A0A9N9ZEK0_9HYPO|nr:unnamed protein product [Clonostachys solani]
MIDLEALNNEEKNSYFELVKIYKDRNCTLFLVRWVNRGITWELEENINDTQLIDDIMEDY